MEKKKILVTYDEMIVGGSTTSLLAFLNCIDKEKYDVELQLYRNKGPLLSDIPAEVKLLPAAELHRGKFGKALKLFKLIISGAIWKVVSHNRRYRTNLLYGRALIEFQAKLFSRKNKTHYDYAIGYLEGWPNKYVAYCVDADIKYCWLHSTFTNMAPIPAYEIPWIKKTDKVVFVAENCKDIFCETLPQFSEKAMTVLNITDDEILRKRSEAKDLNDSEYLAFQTADCFKIITVARIEINVKGLDRAIECAKKLKLQGKRFLWLIVGGGSELEMLRARIEKEKLGDCMKAIGSRINPYPLMKEADIFCLPSRYEGKPMVITESMILGVPPVVTRYLSAEEQIKDRVEGVIAENNDEAIFDAIKYCMENPEMLQSMRAYLSAHTYGNSEYMREIESAYLN